MLAALVSLFAACDASMKAADRLETTYKVQEEDDEDDVIKEAPLTLVKEGTSDEQGTWAPGRGADFAVRSSTYLEMPRTVNGTGHTGPSEFCATSI